MKYFIIQDILQEDIFSLERWIRWNIISTCKGYVLTKNPLNLIS